MTGETIPTLSDRFYSPVEFVERTLSEANGIDRLEAEMVRAMWVEREKGDMRDLLSDVFEALSVAHAGHHAAQILRDTGQDEKAEWFHDVAQIIAAKGVQAFEQIAAFGKPAGKAN